MFRQIVAIGFIFICTAVAWAVLGSTLMMRSFRSESELRGRVQSTWGCPQEQVPPLATYKETTAGIETVTEKGQTVKRVVKTTTEGSLALEQTRVQVGLDLNHRLKGLRWFSTYRVDFHGTYRFRNGSARDQNVTFSLPFPTTEAIYDDLVYSLDGKPLTAQHVNGATQARALVPAGRVVTLEAGYKSQGLDRWSYGLRPGVSNDREYLAKPADIADVRDFELKMNTNFAAVDFPENTLSPTENRVTPQGRELTWRYKSLISGFKIGMTMPEKLQPGPLAARISYFAPVSLFFFFFLMFILTTMRNIDIHPMNYFFLAAAFFSFHLLLAYLVDHLSIHLSFVICSAVSIGLVVSYLRLVVGMRFAAVEAGIAQLLYLVLFSYAFFFRGMTGLVVTIGSILTLFVVMQMTGRIRWAERFSPPGSDPGVTRKAA